MKRIYTKPELFCEEYELSVAIAGDCSEMWNKSYFTQAEIDSCGYRMGENILFSYSVNSTCTQKELIDKEGSGYCYNTVADQPKVFAS